MKPLITGNRSAKYLLIQAVDDHDAALLQSEYELICGYTGREDILLAAFRTDCWNDDLSPWEAPPVFGKDAFGGGAAGTLAYIREMFLPEVMGQHLEDPENVRCIIGGYSLAGLFALWVSYQTNRFCGCAAASPSVWFPGWTAYAASHDIRAGRVYLSLGDKEAKTKNPIMKTVADCIRQQYDILQGKAAESTLEWNPGNHFRDADIRTAKAFAWCIRGK